MSRSRKRRAIEPIDEIEPIETIDEDDVLNISTIPSSLPSSPHSDTDITTASSSHTSIIQQLTLETETDQIQPYQRDENESNDEPLSLSQPIGTTSKKSKVKRSKRSPISTTNSRDIRAMLQSQSRSNEQNKKKQSVSSSSSNGSPPSTSWQHVDIPSLMQYVGIASTGDDAAIAAELQSYEAASTKRVLRSQAKLMNTRPVKSIVDSSNKTSVKSSDTMSNRSIKSPEMQSNKTAKSTESQSSRALKSPEIQPIRSVRSPEICLSHDESSELNETSDHEHPLDVTVIVESVSNELHPIERASTVVNGNPVAINLSPPQSDHSSCLQSHSWLDNASVSHIRKGVNECVVATAPGFYRAYNQDAGMIVDTNDSLVFVVCDGHGALGETASRTACDMLTTKVALAMCQSKDSEVVAQRVMQSFDETQKRLLDIAKIEHTAFAQATTKHRAQQSQSLQTLSSSYEPKSPQLSHEPLIPVSRSPVKKTKMNQNAASSPVEIPMDCDYGTTAVVVACCREWTVIANCGDSRACVWRETSGTKLVRPHLALIFKTEDHNPSENPSEVERVRQDGGAILILHNQYRIYPASMPLEEARSRALTLNMSRALGHRRLNECGISAKPDITQIPNKSTNNQSLVICAGSDGLWDQLSVDDVSMIIERHLPCLECAVSALLREADTRWLARGGGDNITVALCLQHPER